MTQIRTLGLLLAALICVAAAPEASERLADPAREARARALFREVRCLVCQNESIDESSAGLAVDLRRLVRDQVAAGRSDSDIRTYLTDRYGEFVLLKPRFSAANAMLWATPVIAVLGGGLLLLGVLRRRSDTSQLSPEEEARLATLVGPAPD